jgi:hypothetical protein
VTLQATPNLDALRKRLVRATKARGKKAELADALRPRVPLPRISEWLKCVAPGAEVTLQLLAWVQAEEDKQQKSPGSVSAPPEPKTRKRKAHYENHKSGHSQG